MRQTPRRGGRPPPARGRPEGPSGLTGSGGTVRCWRSTQPRPGSKDTCRKAGSRFIRGPSRLSLLYQRRRPARKSPRVSGPGSPRPPEVTHLCSRTLLCWAAPAGLERHWRKRRGPSAGDGLGNRGAIRGLPISRDREHGGTQAVSRRTGSPREPRSEGPKVRLPLVIHLWRGEGVFQARMRDRTSAAIRCQVRDIRSEGSIASMRKKVWRLLACSRA